MKPLCPDVKDKDSCQMDMPMCTAWSPAVSELWTTGNSRFPDASGLACSILNKAACLYGPSQSLPGSQAWIPRQSSEPSVFRVSRAFRCLGNFLEFGSPWSSVSQPFVSNVGILTVWGQSSGEEVYCATSWRLTVWARASERRAYCATSCHGSPTSRMEPF